MSHYSPRLELLGRTDVGCCASGVGVLCAVGGRLLYATGGLSSVLASSVSLLSAAAHRVD